MLIVEVHQYIDSDSAAQIKVPVEQGRGAVQVLDNEDGGEGAVNTPVEVGVDVAKDNKGGDDVPVPKTQKSGS